MKKRAPCGDASLEVAREPLLTLREFGMLRVERC